MIFQQLMGRFDGDRGYLIGCGPSLDECKFDKIGGRPRISINSAAAVVPPFPGLSFNIYTDAPPPGKDWRDVNDYAVIEVCPQKLRSRFPELDGQSPGMPRWNRIEFNLDPDEGILSQSRSEIAKHGRLYQGLGTASTAAHLMWYMGIEVALLVGFDGGTGRAKCLDRWKDELTEIQTRGEMYEKINADFEKTASALGLCFVKF